MTRMVVVALTVGATLACEPRTVLVSEQAQLTFEPAGISAGADRSLFGVDRVLDGTALCGPLGLYRSDSDDDAAAVDACFTQALSGPGTLDGACLTADTPGEITWSFEAQTCAALPDAVDDSFTLTVVGSDAAVPRRELPYRDAARDPSLRLYLPGETDSIAGTDLPDGLWPDDDEPVRWLENGRGDLYVGFVTTADDAPVLWSRDDARVTLRAFSGETPPLVGPPDHGTVLPRAAGAGVVEVSRGSDAWAVGTWQTTPVDELADLGILVATVVDDDGVETPLAARAVLRDTEGHPVFGAQVLWGIAGTGPGGVQLLEPEGDASYALLTGDCLEPPATDRTYTQRVQARIGNLIAEAPITFTLGAREADDPTPFTPGEHCVGPLPGTCGCASAQVRPAAWWGALALLGWVLRRRESTSRPGCVAPTARTHPCRVA